LITLSFLLQSYSWSVGPNILGSCCMMFLFLSYRHYIIFSPVYLGVKFIFIYVCFHPYQCVFLWCINLCLIQTGWAHLGILNPEWLIWISNLPTPTYRKLFAFSQLAYNHFYHIIFHGLSLLGGG